MKKLFTLLNKYVTPLLVMFLVYTSFKLYDQNNVQSSRIDTVNKTLYDIAAHKPEIYKEIQQTQFKEDYYLNQLSNSTTLIMTMIAIIVTLGGFITYKTFDDKVANSEEQLKKSIQKIDKLFINLEEQKKELELRINNTLITSTLAYFSLNALETSNKLTEIALLNNNINAEDKFNEQKLIELFIKILLTLTYLNSLNKIVFALEKNNPTIDLQETLESKTNLFTSTSSILKEVVKTLQKITLLNKKEQTQKLCNEYLLEKINNFNQDTIDLASPFNNIFNT